MPKFSEKSKKQLSYCHDDLQTLFNEVILITDCSIICGYRGQEAQNEAFKTGHSKLQYPHSKHNSLPAMAVDVVPYPIDWNDLKRFNELSVIVKDTWVRLKQDDKVNSLLSWGGDWHSFKDLPHWELG
jgi:peptidoglycan L-alanyl-D-glutamate endopeptidase CwlK